MQRLDLAAPIGYNGRYGNGIWGGISVTKQTVLNQLYRGIIVSCQALPGEPLHGRGMMAAMAQAAKEGGAVGIRANGVEDIAAIRRQVALPVIGIVKAEYPGSPVYITPTEAEVEALLQAGAEILALDATARPRPQGQSLEEFFLPLRQRYPGQLFMADCATLEEARRAQALGFDLVGTTLCGYTQDTLGTPIPSLPLLEAMTRELSVPVIAEGGIWEREQLRQVFAYPVHAAVIGTAITRPREITRRFVEAAGAQEGQYGA